MGSLGLALVKKSLERGRSEGLREGRSEGRSEGLREGRSEGLREGRSEGIMASVRNLMKNMGLSIIEAMNALEVPEEERQRYIEALSK